MQCELQAREPAMKPAVHVLLLLCLPWTCVGFPQMSLTVSVVQAVNPLG